MIMTDLTIPTDDALWRELNEIAQQQNVTVTDVALQALRVYVKASAARHAQRYSFIGIGRHKHGPASTQAEEILQREVDRRTGWGRAT